MALNSGVGLSTRRAENRDKGGGSYTSEESQALSTGANNSSQKRSSRSLHTSRRFLPKPFTAPAPYAAPRARSHNGTFYRAPGRPIRQCSKQTSTPELDPQSSAPFQKSLDFGVARGLKSAKGLSEESPLRAEHPIEGVQ